MCKRNSLDKNEASMGCVRETPQIKKIEASTGCVTETLQVDFFFFFFFKGKKKKEKKTAQGSVRETPCVKVKTARGV